MTYSPNNRLVLEEYKKSALRSEVVKGIAVPGQKDHVVGLKVLMDVTLSTGQVILKGSTAYIREEVLHSHPWASKPLKCDTLPVKFLVADLQFIEFIETLDGPNGDAA